MPKEILIYGGIYSFSAEEFIKALDENKSKDISIRLNTPGGNPLSAYGMIAKMKEHPKQVKIKVDGLAASMGLFFLAYASEVEALDVSRFLLHRAAYPKYYESEMDEAEALELKDINNNLRTALEAKIDVAKFQSITGKTLDEVFSMDNRIDVLMSAEQAKEVGLISKINSITPSELTALNEKYERMAAHSFIKMDEDQKNLESKRNTNTNTSKKMDIEKLRSEHPSVFNQVKALGAKEALGAEKDRVESWLVYSDVDLKAVKEGIESGKDISNKDIVSLNRKQISASMKGNLEDDSAEDLKAGDADGKNAEAVKTQKFNEELDKHLKSL